MKIVFLAMEFAPYMITLYKQILKDNTTELLVFTVSKKQCIAFSPVDKIEKHFTDDFTTEEIKMKILDFSPDILVTSGWTNKKYNKISKTIKHTLKIPTVICSDTQWKGTLRQHFNCIFGQYYLRSIFTHIWIAGVYQYMYARKLNFRKEQILNNLYACDVEKFAKVSIEKKQENYPKNMIFLGRFVSVKGIDILIEAWKSISDKKGWTLTLIGDGPLKEKYQNEPDIFIKNYIDNDKLIATFQECGCFVLPSVYEPWGVVIHEAAAAGIPIICTHNCGAAYHFVIDGYNGFKTHAGNPIKLEQAIIKVLALSENQLIQFSYHSRKLAQRITPELGAAQLMSVVIH